MNIFLKTALYTILVVAGIITLLYLMAKFVIYMPYVMIVLFIIVIYLFILNIISRNE